MDILNYIGIINLVMQITFFVVIILSMKIFRYRWNDVTIGITRIVLVGAVLTVIVYTAIQINKPKPVLQKPMLTKVQLEEIVTNQAQRYGVPISIAKSLVHQESRWNPRAVSSAQASGLCQIMPSTWVLYTDAEDIFNPTSNAKVAMHYLSDLYKKHRSWTVALAYYNAGSHYRCNEAQLYVAQVLSRAEYK